MDEEFTLVSKKKIQDYETKISELKEQLSQKNSHNISKEDIQEIIDNSTKKTTQTISDDISKLVSDTLSSKIDKLHSTVDSKDNYDETLKSIQKDISSLQSQTQSIEKSLKADHSETIKNLKLLVEHFQETDSDDYINRIVDAIKTQVISTLDSESDNKESQSHLEIIEKLQEIELFMTNLRVLLSYIKPSNISTTMQPSSQLNYHPNE